MTWILLLAACGSREPVKQLAFPDWAGSKTELRATEQVRTHDLTVGTGPTADGGDRVTVHYAGWLADGPLFDSSYDRGAPFSATLGRGEVIEGWDQGVRGMAVGGKRGMVLPPHLAYGERGSPPVIPPNSVLVFEIELVALEKAH